MDKDEVAGFRKIGSPRKPTGDTPDERASRTMTHDVMPSNSETTSSTAMVATRPGPTGTALSATGLPEKLPDMADQVNLAIEAWLPPSVSCLIEIKWGWRGPDYDESYIMGYGMKGHPPEEDRQSAMAVLERLDEPCGERFALMELSRLKVLTKSREQGEDFKFQMAVMAEGLGAYPCDVVREACRTWKSKWFPAWAELRDECDAAAKMRRDLLEALR